MMKKNYLYFGILVLATVIVTLLLANLYDNEVEKISYAYNNLSKITANEFEEYIVENDDVIIYIGDKNNLKLNSVEKKLIKKLEKNNLIKNTIYIEKEEITSSLKKQFEEKYSYVYDGKLPLVIIVSDSIVEQIVKIDKTIDINSIINYEVFE